MDRPFFEVFSNLKVDKDLESFLENASISKVVTNSNRDSMRVYMECKDLVPKRRIWKLEEEIKKQYFGRQNLEVNILEKFRL
jgi:DNA polymerase-3 subunit alpha (Gram-positive type)